MKIILHVKAPEEKFQMKTCHIIQYVIYKLGKIVDETVKFKNCGYLGRYVSISIACVSKKYLIHCLRKVTCMHVLYIVRQYFTDNRLITYYIS